MDGWETQNPQAGKSAILTSRLSTLLPHDQPVQRVDPSRQLPREGVDVLGEEAGVPAVPGAAMGQAIERNNHLGLGYERLLHLGKLGKHAVLVRILLEGRDVSLRIHVVLLRHDLGAVLVVLEAPRAHGPVTAQLHPRPLLIADIASSLGYLLELLVEVLDGGPRLDHTGLVALLLPLIRAFSCSRLSLPLLLLLPLAPCRCGILLEGRAPTP